MPKPTTWPVPVKTPFGPLAIGAATTPVAIANNNRLTFDLVNTGTEVCWITEGAVAVLGQGDAIYPAGTAHMDEANLFLGVINAI